MYRGYDHGVSKVVRDAYESYGDMEFGTKNRKKFEDRKSGIPIDEVNRHIKLIGIAGKVVILVELNYVL